MPADEVDPYLLAVQQYVYWRELGLSHAEMLEACGVIPLPPHIKRAETTIRWLAFAYRRHVLRGRWAA